MSRSSYGALLRTPSVGWLLASSMIARVPIGMVGLAIVLAVTRSGGSYTRAGAVSAAVVFAQGAAGPVFGRAADRLGRRRILRVLAVANAAAAVGLAWAITAATPVLFAFAVVTGASSPPVVATMRAAWSGLVSGPARQAAYALEATTQEVQFIIGPMLAALLAAAIAPRAAVGAVGIISMVGTLAMTRTDAVEAREEPTGEHHRASALRIGALRRCMLTLGLTIMALACVEIAIIAAISNSTRATPFAGVVVALWSVGSAIGGLWYGARRRHSGQPAAASVALVGASFLLLTISTNRVVLVTLLVLGGTTVAPMFGRLYAEVSAVTPPSVITEAYGWISVANLTGVSIGAPLGGYLVGAASPRVAFFVGSAAVGIASLVAIGLRTPAKVLPEAPYESAVRTGP